MDEEGIKEEKIKEKEELEKKVWRVVVEFGKKCVRKEKEGYMELYQLLYHKSVSVESIVNGLLPFILEEDVKGFSEDIEFRCYSITFRCYLGTNHPWYRWVGVEAKNRISGRSVRGEPVTFGSSFATLVMTKEDFLKIEDLKKQFEEEERNARIILSREIDALRKCEERAGQGQ